jgi:LAS superfamily LD-carboxypeptidase LdcB
MNVDILFGKTQEHLVPLEGTKFLLHKLMLHDFLKLQQSAKNDGFDLQIISAFRDYERQLKIWNAKARGERQLMDDQERPLEFSKLSPTEIVFAILRWSAIPGCSRHHWGSDIDVFDGSTQKAEDVKLVPSECENNGPATALHDWLDIQIKENKSFGFFRPYAFDKGGVSPERWHLSYYPVSRRVLDVYTFSIFKRHIENSDVMFKEIILKHAEDIFQRYLMNFDLP